MNKGKVYDSAKNKLHVVLVNGAVFRNGKVLVSQRSWKETHMPGKWTIPGGKVEKTKGGVYRVIEKTLKKEIKEEVGITIRQGAPAGRHSPAGRHYKLQVGKH